MSTLPFEEITSERVCKNGFETEDPDETFFILQKEI
jgi:hypothetical protein